MADDCMHMRVTVTAWDETWVLDRDEAPEGVHLKHDFGICLDCGDDVDSLTQFREDRREVVFRWRTT